MDSLSFHSLDNDLSCFLYLSELLRACLNVNLLNAARALHEVDLHWSAWFVPALEFGFEAISMEDVLALILDA